LSHYMAFASELRQTSTCMDSEGSTGGPLVTSPILPPTWRGRAPRPARFSAGPMAKSGSRFHLLLLWFLLAIMKAETVAIRHHIQQFLCFLPLSICHALHCDPLYAIRAPAACVCSTVGDPDSWLADYGRTGPM